MSLTFVNQVGAPEGLNQAAPGSFLPESFVRWSQDVLFDRVGQLRRRSPFVTASLYNATGTAAAQPDGEGERVLGVVSTRNFNNENRFAIVVSDGSVTRLLFYNDEYRKQCFCPIEVVSQDAILFSRPALDGGVFLGFLEKYGGSGGVETNKNMLYYWRGGTGQSNYALDNATLNVTNDVEITATYTHNDTTFTCATPHNLAAGYKINITNQGTSSDNNPPIVYPWALGQTLTVSSNNLTTTTFEVNEINAHNEDSTDLKFVIAAHVTHTNTISRSGIDTTKVDPGMFVYRVANPTSYSNNTIVGGTEYYLGTVKAVTSTTITLEKDIIRTFGHNTSLHGLNTNQYIKFVNVRPYIHNHGRGLITRANHAFTVTSGSVGSEGEGHFAAAGLDSGWALYRASDGAWIGDVSSVTSNAALTLSSLAHSEDIIMNADEYVAYKYGSIVFDPDNPDPTRYTGCFNTTYAGYQWFGNAGSLGNENRIVFSAYHNPESVDLSKDAADSIVIPGKQQMRGIATSSSGLIIFLEDKTYILRGNYRSNFSLEELYPEGCLSAQSIVEYGGGVFWAAKSGLLFYDGATVRNLTEQNLGSYYTDSITSFDASDRRIYGFFYKDYLFMTFTGFASNYTPLRYEPLYADTIQNTPSGITLEQIRDLDPSFTSEDFFVESNTPVYWKSYNMYTSKGVTDKNTSGKWSAGKSYPNAVVTSGSTTVTGLTNIVVGDVGKPIIGYGIPSGATIATRVSATEITMSAAATASSSPSTTPPSSVQILPVASTGNTWGKSLQFVWGPVNFIESMTFAVYLPSNAITAISNFDFRGFIKLDSYTGTKGFAGINAVDPDGFTGTYARLIDVDSMLNPTNTHTEVFDSELSENLGKQKALYYKGPDFYLQTKHFTVGDPILKKWFRQIMLNLYLLDGGMRLDMVDLEDNDDIDITKKKQRNWALFDEAGYSWSIWERRELNTIASPNQPTWNTIQNIINTSWYTLTDAEFTRRKKKISWRYPSAGFRLYQMNDYRPSNYPYAQRPHTVMLDSWSIGFKPMRASRV